MPLEFDRIINLSTYTGNPAPAIVDNLQISNEPNNQINQFYIHNIRAGDKDAQVTLSNYNSLAWAGPHTRLTTQRVKRVGVKTFPQLGTMAFYSLLHEERSFLLCPLFITEERYTRPGFSIQQDESTVTFTMQTPEDILYLCWRIVMRCGDTAFEYVSYDDTLTVENPYLSGTYDCYCVGYVGEGQAVSDDSVHITVDIVGSNEDPLDKFLFYTRKQADAILAELDELHKQYVDNLHAEQKVYIDELYAAQKQYIDELIGEVNDLVDQINGEVI